MLTQMERNEPRQAYCKIMPVDNYHERKLFRATLKLHSKLSKNFGVVLEFIPTVGVKVYAPENITTKLPESEIRLVLTEIGCTILEDAGIQGNVQVMMG